MHFNILFECYTLLLLYPQIILCFRRSINAHRCLRGRFRVRKLRRAHIDNCWLPTVIPGLSSYILHKLINVGTLFFLGWIQCCPLVLSPPHKLLLNSFNCVDNYLALLLISQNFLDLQVVVHVG